MSTLLAIVVVPALLFFVAYLAACAGAQRWLSIREWWRGSKK